MAGATVDEVMAELAGLDVPKVREVNARHGDGHGVNLGKLRALAKRLKTRQDLAVELWETGDSAARQAWMADSDPVVASAGRALTVERVAKKPEIVGRRHGGNGA
ncbi:hypothetical protein GCM10009801_10090 [Streptomyces albiaxialis]|uniref:DNA alkylation repair protein n=1 Tax=Streptomyces albiaxialis TaxID=329523 RepID=A0ABP5HA31_9ACTN